MRKNARDTSWREHKPPKEDEPCPWLGLFGDCVSDKCIRCRKGAQPMDKKSLQPIRAAFEQAVGTSEEARKTLALMRF